MDDVTVNRIKDSFARQGLMRQLRARVVSVARGEVVVEVPFSEQLTQQNGYFHAAVSTAIADTAGGYAALSLMDEGNDVLAVEFKVNLLRPAAGEKLIAEASVLKAGRTLTVCQTKISSVSGGKKTLVAVMTQTNIRVRPREA